MNVPFIDLGAMHHDLADEISAAIGRVVERGTFILGPRLNDDCMRARWAR
jgi:hypothetical protein